MKSRLDFVINSSSSVFFFFGIPNENMITIDGVYDRLPNDNNFRQSNSNGRMFRLIFIVNLIGILVN